MSDFGLLNYIDLKNEDLNFTFLWALAVPDVTFGTIGRCVVAESVRCLINR